MKIKFGVAVSGAVLCMGAAAAQSGLTLYGTVDAGLVHENKGEGGQTRIDSGLLNDSRIGFALRQTLDSAFGPGLALVGRVESGFYSDTGTSAQGGLLVGRQSWLGLEGPLGSVKLGRQTTVMFDHSHLFDPFGDSLAAGSSRLFNFSGHRSSNVLSYAHAAGNWRGQLQYGLGEEAGQAGRNAALVLVYRRSALDVVLLQQLTRQAVAATGGRHTLVGGNLRHGPITWFAAHGRNRDLNLAGAVVPGADTRHYLLGAAARFGPNGKLMLSHARLQDRVRDDGGARLHGVGYSHALSLRSAVSASVSRLANQPAASYRAARPGQADRLLYLGLRHRF